MEESKGPGEFTREFKESAAHLLLKREGEAEVSFGENSHNTKNGVGLNCPQGEGRR